jgi:hypothetical protein
LSVALPTFSSSRFISNALALATFSTSEPRVMVSPS